MKLWILTIVAIVFLLASCVNIFTLFNTFELKNILLIASILIIPSTLRDIRDILKDELEK